MSTTRAASSLTIKLTTFLRENLTLLLLFPTILGGFEQFAILCFSSFSLLSYYSHTRVPIDGISILIKVPLFLICFFIMVQYDAAKNNINIKAKWGILVFLSVLIMMIIAVIALLFVHKDYKQLGRLGYVVIANILILWRFQKDKRFLLTFNNKATFVIAGSILFSTFYNIFTTPDYSEISNINGLTSKIQLKYPRTKLLYCNDKYLFYDRDSSQINTVDKYEIVPIEQLFLEHYESPLPTNK